VKYLKLNSSTLGFLIFDRYWLKKLWHKDDTTQLNIYLKKGASSSEFIKKLKSRLPSTVAIDIYDNNRLKMRVLEIFDRTFVDHLCNSDYCLYNISNWDD